MKYKSLLMNVYKHVLNVEDAFVLLYYDKANKYDINTSPYSYILLFKLEFGKNVLFNFII